MSSLKPKLQRLSDWTVDIAKVATGAVELTMQSGWLQDSLEDLCDVGGVAGALFKIGARVIPRPTVNPKSDLGRQFAVAGILVCRLGDSHGLVPSLAGVD